jgi:hypothetical protein
MDNELLSALRDDLRGYHGDVKRRLDLAEDEIKDLRLAIYGRAGDETVPGLNVEVQTLRKGFDGFQRRVHAIVAAAWAAVLGILSIVLTRKA